MASETVLIVIGIRFIHKRFRSNLIAYNWHRTAAAYGNIYIQFVIFANFNFRERNCKSENLEFVTEQISESPPAVATLPVQLFYFTIVGVSIVDRPTQLVCNWILICLVFF